MKNNTLIQIGLTAAITIGGVTQVFAEPEALEAIYAPSLGSLQEAITDISTLFESQDSYFEELQDNPYVAFGVLSDISTDLSDISTDVNNVETDLEIIDETNYEEILSTSHTALLTGVVPKLADLQEEHKQTLKDHIVETFLTEYKSLIENIAKEIAGNEAHINEYEELTILLDDIDDIIGDLETEFSEGDWVRLEEKLKQVQEILQAEQVLLAPPSEES